MSRQSGRDAAQLGEYTHEQATTPSTTISSSPERGGGRHVQRSRRFGYMTLIPESEIAHDAFFRG